MAETLLVVGGDDVRALLGWDDCIQVVREAMIALSAGATRQLPRHIMGLGDGRAFGLMAGGLDAGEGFGAKLISVYPANHERGLPSHQGVVLLHDEATGAPACIADAREITRIRTASASAAATAALARPDSARLAILGYGEQAHAHAHAIPRVRGIREIRIWGRSPARAFAFAKHVSAELDIPVRAEASVEACIDGADIVCTTTAAAEPILGGAQVAPGTHVNLVGSSRAGPAEADAALVARARFFADSRSNVIAEGSEFRAAVAAGLVDESHIAGEIGEVLDGARPGRAGDAEITVYKSLGHIVQDIAAARHVFAQATAQQRGMRAPF